MVNKQIMGKEYRLPKEFTIEWLKALRSGNYKQTTGILYNQEKDAYCCLGVACRIKYPLHYLKGKDGLFANLIGNKLKCNLHKIPDELKSKDHNTLTAALTALNDKKYYTFNEIADWIEENVELY